MQFAATLGALFERYGYTPYKMSKFEEYDLYARNKDFLVSDHVITFTDLSGKLMALKPDVTLSIVKNSKDLPWVQKVYYNENVYRVTKGSHGFREMTQLGLEAQGDIDDYTITEVMGLAMESLAAISEEAVLDVSHLGILKELTDAIDFPIHSREALVKLISQKNPHEIAALCESCGVAPAHSELLCWLASTSGSADAVVPQMRSKLTGFVSEQTLSRIEQVLSALDSRMLRIDFSVVDDIHYYNGFVFKGFVDGIPDSVLSGGQYDKLMKKMNRTAKAIGFAVYMDLLQRLEADGREYDVDAVLLYDTDDLTALRQTVKALTDAGTTVLVQRVKPENIRCKKLLKLSGCEVETLEENA